jgi:hypothetical protein
VEAWFHREWARALFTRAVAALERRSREEGRTAAFAVFQRYDLEGAPETAPQIVGIVIGSTIKGVVTGLIIGLVARRTQSLAIGVGVGILVGVFLVFLVALGDQYYWRRPRPHRGLRDHAARLRAGGARALRRR